MTPTEEADLEFRSIRAAWNTLRKLGYTYEGGQVWMPPPETRCKEAATSVGWYEVWQVRGGKKRSFCTYAYRRTGVLEPWIYFDFGGQAVPEPEPYGSDQLGYVKCNAPFKELSHDS